MFNWLKKLFHTKTINVQLPVPPEPYTYPYRITAQNLFKYSEHVKHVHVPEKLTDDDIIQISHKLADGKYETTFIRLKQLKEYLCENK